jgi:hypothetical protein
MGGGSLPLCVRVGMSISDGSRSQFISEKDILIKIFL